MIRFLGLSVAILAMTAPTLAQDDDFNLTYHVERTPSSKLTIEKCGDVVTETAQKAGLRSDIQDFPGQLVVVTGGIKGKGAFVVQCINVDNVTVSVVQGIDYRQQKGALGRFADKTFEALKAAIK